MANFSGLPTARNITRVAPQRAAAVQATPAASGENVAAETRRLGEQGLGAVRDAAIELRNEGERINGQAHMNEANKLARELKDGRAASEDGTVKEQVGYLSLKQDSALRAEEEYSTQLNTGLDAILEGAENPRVRRLIEQSIETLRGSTLSTFGRHSRTQRDAYANTVLLTTITEGTQTAMSHALEGELGVKEVFRENGDLSNVRKATRTYWERQGLKGADVQSKVDTATTGVHTAVIKGLLKAGRVSEAREYYDRAIKGDAGKGFDSTSRGEMLNLIKGDEVQARSISEASLAKDGNDLTTAAGAEKALTDMRKKLSGKGDEDVLIAAEKRLKTLIAEDGAFKEQAIAERFDSVAERARKGAAIPESDKKGLSARQRNYITEAQDEARFMAANPNYKRPGDGGKTWKLFYDAAEDGKVLPTMTVSELSERYEFGVTKKQWDSVILPTWQRQALAQENAADAAKAKKPEVGPAGLTPVNMVSIYAQDPAVGIDPKKDVEEFVAWQLEFDTRVAREQAVTAAQKRQILLGMVRENIIFDISDFPGSDDSSALAFALTDEQKATFADDIEPDEDGFELTPAQQTLFVQDYDRILRGMRKQKLSINRQSIIQAFTQTHKIKKSIK